MKNITGRALKAFFLIFIPLFFHPLSASGRPAPSEKSFRLGGDFRILATHSSFPDFQPVFPDSSQFIHSLMRLSAQGRLNTKLQYNFHLVQNMDYSSRTEGRIFFPGTGKQRYRLFDTPWEWLQEDTWTGGLFFDRLNARMSFSWADLTIGRQAATFGKTYFWNPLDVFLPFRLWDIDRDYKPGIDALRLDIPLGLFSGISFIGAPGKEIILTEDFSGTKAKNDVSWYGSALTAHFHTTSSHWDLTVQAGKIYGGFHLGGGAAGQAGLFNMRVEAAWFSPAGNRSRPLPSPLKDELMDSHLSAAAGLGLTLPGSLIMEMEYFYNGAAEAGNPETALLRMVHGSSLHISTHLLGFISSFDILPIAKGRITWILSLQDRSLLLQPCLSLSLSNEAELELGAAISSGASPYWLMGGYPRIRTEFGTYPDVCHLLLKYYF